VLENGGVENVERLSLGSITIRQTWVALVAANHGRVTSFHDPLWGFLQTKEDNSANANANVCKWEKTDIGLLFESKSQTSAGSDLRRHCTALPKLSR
jgi:hypothetical protein